MKSSSLFIVAAVSVALIIAVLVKRDGNTEVNRGGALYPELASQLDKVASVEVRNASNTVLLTKDGEQWGVAARNGYPVNMASLRKLLRHMANSQIIEPKTSNPELYNRIGVAEFDNADETKKNSTRRVTLKDSAGTVLADLIVGDSATRGAFVRPVGAKESLLVDQELRASATVTEWIDENLLSVPKQAIQRVEVSPPASPAWAAVNTDREKQIFTIEPVPQGRELAPAASSRPVSALRDLRIRDVLADENQPTEGWTTSRWITWDGLIVELVSRTDGSDTLARLSAKVDPTLAVAEKASDSAESKATPTPDSEAEQLSAEEQAKQINAKAKGRLFLLTVHQANNTRLRLEQLLKPKVEEPEDEPLVPLNLLPESEG